MKQRKKIQRLPPLPAFPCANCGCTDWLVVTYKPIAGDDLHVVAHLRCAECGCHATQTRPKKTR